MRADRGFTLIEVMVAFVIAVVALSVMARAGLAGLDAAGESARYQEATARAQSHLAAIGSAATASDRQGDEGDGFHWHVRITPRGTVALPGQKKGQVTLLAVSVVVSWAGRAVTLDSERLVSAAP
jgi:general secretion pathway protein I